MGMRGVVWHIITVSLKFFKKSWHLYGSGVACLLLYGCISPKENTGDLYVLECHEWAVHIILLVHTQS